jgi:hypothetical protein
MRAGEQLRDIMTAIPRAFDDAQIAQFIREGFIRIDNAFPRDLAEAARAIMWRDLPCREDDPSSWTRPVIRLPGYGDPPFRDAINTAVLRSAFDQIVGPRRWRPRRDIGTIPVRFPHPDDPGDAGWHVDLSFPGADCDPNETRDFSAWRVNITSRGRALLLLFLFSDIGEDDAPTRIRVGSHVPMARDLAPAGEAGRRAWCWTRWEPIVPLRSRPALPAPSISAIPSWFMPRRGIRESGRVSWHSRRFFSPSPTGWSGPMASTRRSKPQSG